MAVHRNVATGPWVADQGNGFRVTFTLTQSPFISKQGIPPTGASPGVPTQFDDNRATLKGSARTTGLSTGKCHGVLTDNSFVITVPWDQTDSVGEYSGTFNAIDKIVGVSVDTTHPGNVTPWVSESAFPL